MNKDIYTPARHPLARFLRSVATGTPIPEDGSWMRVSPWSPDIQAVLNFGAHSLLAVSYDYSDNDLVEMGVDGYGKSANPRVLTRLAGAAGWIGTHDALLIGAGRGAGIMHEALVSRPDFADRPAVEQARRLQTAVQVMGREDQHSSDMVILGSGVGGVRQITIDLAPKQRGYGYGSELMQLALSTIPENELVVATVFAADAGMLAAYLAEGFKHIGSIQCFSSRPERR